MIKISKEEYIELSKIKEWHENYLQVAIEREEQELKHLENYLEESNAEFHKIKEEHAKNVTELLFKISEKQQHIKNLINKEDN